MYKAGTRREYLPPRDEEWLHEENLNIILKCTKIHSGFVVVVVCYEHMEAVLNNVGDKMLLRDKPSVVSVPTTTPITVECQQTEDT